MKEYILELFITGNSARSEMAIRNLQKVCEEKLAGKYQLKIVDVLDSPQDAEDSKVLATPTLIKVLPPPVRRLIGDFTDLEKLKFYLDI